MRLEVLGCWGPYPAPGDATSGYLLTAGDTAILVDIGHGSFGVLSGLVDFRRLTAAFVSHWHPDHAGDLPALRHAIRGALKDGSRGCGLLPLYVLDKPETEYDSVRKLDDAFAVHPYSAISSGKVDIGPIRVEWLPTLHAMPCMALAFTEGERRLVYTADAALSEELTAFAQGADLLIAEASGLNKDESYVRDNHMTAGQTGVLARRAGVRRLVLTHLYPEYDMASLKAQAAETFGREVTTAVEVRSYDL